MGLRSSVHTYIFSWPFTFSGIGTCTSVISSPEECTAHSSFSFRQLPITPTAQNEKFAHHFYKWSAVGIKLYTFWSWVQCLIHQNSFYLNVLAYYQWRTQVHWSEPYNKWLKENKSATFHTKIALALSTWRLQLRLIHQNSFRQLGGKRVQLVTVLSI